MSNRYCIRGAIAALLLALGGTGASHLTAQTGAVTGVITDTTTRQPLEGATVNLAGIPASALTDTGGRYLLDGVPPGTYTVKVVVPGYGTRSREVEVMPEGTLEIDFRLRVSGVDPDQLVAVGLAGRTERRKIGASLPTIDVDRLTETTPLDGFSQVLEGRIPGVRANGTSGGIGAGRELRIRGTDSFRYTRQRPLVLIDGVRIDTNKEEWGWMEGVSCCFFSGGAGEDRLSDLNPEEIDRVEVLKGPAAAALFGSEGSAGVIRVFTKRGRNNTPPTFTLNTGIGLNRLRANLPTKLRPTVFAGPAGDQALDPNEYLIEDGLVNNYDLTMSGGGEDVTYFVAGGLNYEEGSVKPNDQTRGNLRVNLNWAVSENLTVGVVSGHVRNRIWSLQSGNNGLGVYTRAMWRNWATGDPRSATWEMLGGGSVADAKAIRTISDTDRWTGRVQLEYRPGSSFTHQLTVGADHVSELKTRSLPWGIYYNTLGSRRGEKNVGNRESRKYTLDFLSTYDYKNLLGVSFLSGSLSVGGQAYWDDMSTLMATGRDFPSEGSLSIADARLIFADNSTYDERSRGAFVLNRLDLGENLFLTAAVRVDDHSAFGDSIDTQVYPKADVAYSVPESFLPPGISSLRFRGAYGMAGKPPPRETARKVYDRDSRDSVDIPASQLREPENKREVETGLDLGLLNDRIGVEVTYYNARVLNGLHPQRVAEPVAHSRAENSIQIMNRGLEAVVTAWLIDAPAFRWNMNLAYEWNRNRITDFGPQALDDSLAVYRQRADGTWEQVKWLYTRKLGGWHVGESLDNVYGRDIAGYDPVTNRHRWTVHSFVRGSAHPTHIGSVFNSFQIGEGLRLAFQLRGEMGAVMLNAGRAEGVRSRSYDEYLRHLDEEGRPTYKADSVRDFHGLNPVDKRDHIRLQEVSLSYTVPQGMTGMLGLKRTTVTLSGYNLHWWDNCNCQDPNARHDAADTGYNVARVFMALPQPRRFILSVRTQF